MPDDISCKNIIQHHILQKGCSFQDSILHTPSQGPVDFIFQVTKCLPPGVTIMVDSVFKISYLLNGTSTDTLLHTFFSLYFACLFHPFLCLLHASDVKQKGLCYTVTSVISFCCLLHASDVKWKGLCYTVTSVITFCSFVLLVWTDMSGIQPGTGTLFQPSELGALSTVLTFITKTQASLFCTSFYLVLQYIVCNHPTHPPLQMYMTLPIKHCQLMFTC